MKNNCLYLIAAMSLLVHCKSIEEKPVSSYVVEDIRLPDGLIGETGGLAFLPDGRLVACFLRGEVMIYDPRKDDWKVFAHGLHEPLGVLVINAREMLVMQRPELTRLVDTDDDGQADLFETVCDAFGMTGNYHEWNYGPVVDHMGNLFISLNTASEYGHIQKEVRGRLDTTLVPGKPLQKYAAVPYRGWIMKIDKDGSIQPYASGFRSPNGMVVDDRNRLFATDNQGDWVGTSKFYHVQKDQFYGHPASLIWTEGWNRGDPSKLPIEELEAMRTKASVLFPHGIIAASPTQPVIDETNGAFGPFAGQFLIGEMNQERILRVMLEEIGGELQGACIPFLDGHGLRKGNNRLAFAPDGSLWVGQAEHFFAGDLGIQRISYTGKIPMDIVAMHLLPDGFELTFTQPLAKRVPVNLNQFKFRHYYYQYHLQYGSDQFDVMEVPVTDAQLSDDRKNIKIKIPVIKTGYVYELNIDDLLSENGDTLQHNIICYTVNHLQVLTH